MRGRKPKVLIGWELKFLLNLEFQDWEWYITQCNNNQIKNVVLIQSTKRSFLIQVTIKSTHNCTLYCCYYSYYTFFGAATWKSRLHSSNFIYYWGTNLSENRWNSLQFLCLVPSTYARWICTLLQCTERNFMKGHKRFEWCFYALIIEASGLYKNRVFIC